MGGCLSDCELKQEKLQKENPRNVILLKFGETQEFAIGLARQNAIASDLQAEIGTSEVSPLTTSGMEETKPDHAVGVFQLGTNGKWKVKDCLAVVDLKLSDNSCSDFKYLNDGKIIDVSLDSAHGALGQVILYNLACVLPCHARRGVLGNDLPLAILAGKRSSTWEKQIKVQGYDRGERLRWVSGKLEIPETCGGRFEYSVTDCGYFYNEGDDEEAESLKSALSLYLKTILFGLTHAMRVHQDITESTMAPAVAASGRSLAIGGVACDLRFCASPIRGANPVRAAANGDVWSISQGDLFAGKLEVSKKLWESEARYVDFIDDSSREVDVLVKVSSPAVHRLLIFPQDSFAALERVRLRQSQLTSEIGAVLFGTIGTKNGLVTIMADLSKQGYRMLEPKTQRDKLSVLWAGFSALVNNVLLPMARIDVIHPDIRPGFDVTSNVLCKFDDATENASIRLIDYESIVSLSNWHAPTGDGRYINIHSKWNGTAFVWWQCVCLGYAWHNELDSSVLRNNVKHFKELRNDFYGPRSMDWWKELDYSAEDITDEQCVRDTLIKLGNVLNLERRLEEGFFCKL